jgi:2'-5' RNA ligase
MRLFVAVQLPDLAIDHLRRVQAHCRSIAPDGNYTRDVNLHLTLRFLGETGEDRLEPLKDALRRTVSGGAMNLAATRLIGFPHHAPARILGAFVAGAMGEQLQLLQSAIERAMRACGVAAEERRFTPHVTLARPARPIPLPAILNMAQATAKSWPGPDFEVRRVYLMQSEPSPGGSRYRTIADFDLFG